VASLFDRRFLAQKNALNQNMTAEIQKMDRIINRVKSKIADVQTAEIEECLYCTVNVLLNSDKGPSIFKDVDMS
jgi:hypothetical protein